LSFSVFMSNKNLGVGATPVLAFTSIEVSEASPHAVVAAYLSNASTQPITFYPYLKGGCVTGKSGDHASATLEYFELNSGDHGSWTPVDPSLGVTIAAGQIEVLLRAALTNDSFFEGKEELRIHSGKIKGGIKTGIDDIHTDNHNQAFGTIAIVDDGSNANVFLDDRSSDEATEGIADDDRLLAVTSVTVNEASPYAVFSVTGAAGQLVSLTLAPGATSAATPGTDYTDSIEISTDNGSNWTSYTTGLLYTAQGSAIDGSLGGVPFSNASWVVSAVVDEGLIQNTVFTKPPLGTFDFWLTSVQPSVVITTTTGERMEASLLSQAPLDWIVLSGKFPVGPDPKIGFVYTNSSFFPETAAGLFGVPGLYIDMKSPVVLSGPSVFEANVYPSTAGSLVITSTTNNPGTFSVTVPAPSPLNGTGTLLVRIPVLNDNPAVDEPDETFTLTATNTGGEESVGTATIVDNRNGTIFNDDGFVNDTATKDDDRPALNLATEFTFTNKRDTAFSDSGWEVVSGATVETLAGKDVVTGTAGSYGIVISGTLNTGAGNDVVTGMGGNYGILIIGGTLDTGAGKDIVDALNGGFAGNGTANLGAGNDVLKGFQTDNVLGEGRFYGGCGRDQILLDQGEYTIAGNLITNSGGVAMNAFEFERIGGTKGKLFNFSDGILTVDVDGVATFG
jgi:hypothetical protein